MTLTKKTMIVLSSISFAVTGVVSTLAYASLQKEVAQDSKRNSALNVQERIRALRNERSLLQGQITEVDWEIQHLEKTYNQMRSSRSL